MTRFSDFWSLIKLILQFIAKIFGRKKEEKPEPITYTREQFMEAVKELTSAPHWRARILRDILDKIREKHTFDAKWIDKDDLTTQTLHRLYGCGMYYSFGKGIYALPKEQWEYLIGILQQDQIKYVAQFTDCDNFATFFKGFADYVVGKPVVIYSTGLVLKPKVYEEYGGRKTCVCKSEYLVGGHGWNRIVTTEPCEVQKVGTTEILKFDFTIYNYEPQNDLMVADRIVGEYCYQNGGGLPVIYGKRR